MQRKLLTLKLRVESDVVHARQRARQLAQLLGLDLQDQTRFATAVSEITRNAVTYGRGGGATFLVDESVQRLEVVVKDQGPGIADLDHVLSGRYESPTGMGRGLVGSRNLVEHFDVQTSSLGTTVTLGKLLPPRGSRVDAAAMRKLVEELSAAPQTDPLEEARRQNQELLLALQQLSAQKAELTELNRELSDTNRGVLALYAELDDKAASLQKASEEKSRFLSYISHEFRTPLNAIRSLSRILAQHAPSLDDEARKQLGFIRQAAENLGDMVNDLLDLGKVEAGKVTLEVEDCDVELLLGALRGMFRPLLPETGAVDLVFDAAADVRNLRTDEGKLTQILRNFISNALKFTEKGQVLVRATRAEGGLIRISVSDTGIGIAFADQKRIFEEYAQVDSRLQRQHKGTGLGLPLAKRLAELLGGRVGLTSAPGAGSTFWVELPEHGPDARAGATAEANGSSATILSVSEPEPSAGPRRILLVDDSSVARYLIGDILRDLGFETDEAGSGSDGIRRAAQTNPIAIVLDLVMPDMGGLETLERLKADPRTAGIPVIVNSSFLPEEERPALDAKAAALMTKDLPTRDAAIREMRRALEKAGVLRAPSPEECHAPH